VLEKERDENGSVGGEDDEEAAEDEASYIFSGHSFKGKYFKEQRK
jgi:hypothetical protein